MAARRSKSQARRHPGSGGLPGWAWGVMGLLLGVGLFVAGPKLLKSDGDGFFRPQPNPDAQPAPVAGGEDDAVATDGDTPLREGAERASKRGPKAGVDATDEKPEYDFYTLLPGKEVPLSDAELAATERAETQRAAQQTQVAAATPGTATTGAGTSTATTTTTTNPLPLPVATGGDPMPPTPSTAATPPAKPPATTATNAVTQTPRYLLQAGAFQASGQAEGLKARIALLGLGARVESASIGGKTVYRVRMGPYGSAGDLAEAKRKLASGGLPGMAIQVK